MQTLKNYLKENNFDIKFIEETPEYKKLSQRNVRRLQHYCQFEPLYLELMNEDEHLSKKEISVPLKQEKF